MLITIIIPFHNVEAKLFAQQMHSILSQSYADKQIIIADDASSTEGALLAKSYADSHNEVELLRLEKNLGPGGARNEALKLAKGDYIWFVDADDQLMHHDVLSQIMLYIHQYESPDILLFGCRKQELNGVIFDATNAVAQPLLLNAQEMMHYFAKEARENHTHSPLEGYLWHKCFKRSFIQEYGGNLLERTSYEDMISMLWLGLADRVLILPDLYYFYVRRGDSLVGSPMKSDFYQDALRVFAQLASVGQEYRHIEGFSQHYYLLVVLFLADAHMLSQYWSLPLPPALREEVTPLLYQMITLLIPEPNRISELLPIDNLFGFRPNNHGLKLFLAGLGSTLTLKEQKIALDRLLFNKKIWRRKVIQKAIPSSLLPAIRALKRKFG